MQRGPLLYTGTIDKPGKPSPIDFTHPRSRVRVQRGLQFFDEQGNWCVVHKLSFERSDGYVQWRPMGRKFVGQDPFPQEGKENGINLEQFLSKFSLGYYRLLSVKIDGVPVYVGMKFITHYPNNSPLLGEIVEIFTQDTQSPAARNLSQPSKLNRFKSYWDAAPTDEDGNLRHCHLVANDDPRLVGLLPQPILGDDDTTGLSEPIAAIKRRNIERETQERATAERVGAGLAIVQAKTLELADAIRQFKELDKEGLSSEHQLIISGEQGNVAALAQKWNWF